MSQDPEDLMQIDITDENGETRQAWVCRIVAERDLTTTGPGGEKVVVANKGDKGGYVECDVEFDEDGKPHPVLPVQPGEEGAPSDKYEGQLKGLSQRDDSWVGAGSVIAGEVSVRDDAQIVGPDTMITGADQYVEDVGAGGSYYRSSGASTFEGRGSYVDMELDPGANYQFTGGTQVGGPVHFEAGAGEFGDGPDGEETMLFAAEEGTSLTVATKEGFKSNGLTALDNCEIRGEFEGSPGMIVQNSQINVEGTKFTGPVTVVNQVVGQEANGLELASDVDVDSVALTAMADVEPGLTGTERRDRAESFRAYTDGQEYRDHVDRVLAHELGENFGDTGVQNHQDDIHGKMHDQLLADWDQMPEDTRPEDFYESHRISSEYQAGINDAPTEDERELMEATGMTMDEIDAALTERDGGRKIASRDVWNQFSGIRGEHQPDAHQNMTSGHSQRELGGDGGGLNPDASEGLLNKDTPLTPTGKTTKKVNLGSLEETLRKAKEAEDKTKGDDTEYGS